MISNIGQTAINYSPINNNMMQIQDIALQKYNNIIKQASGYIPNDTGFWGDDFNKKIGIPIDIKINSSIAASFSLLETIGYYNNINTQESIKQMYNKFTSLSNSQMDNLVQIAKKQTFLDANNNTSSLFEELLANKHYSNDGIQLNKSGLFEIYMKTNFDMIVGDKTIALEIQQGSEFSKFVSDEDNLIGMNILDKGKAGSLLRQNAKDISVEDFKKEWEKLRDEYKRNKDTTEINNNISNTEENNSNKRKPIQGKSDNNETYRDENVNKVLQTLLESKFNKEKMLDILFGTNINNGNDDSMEIISEMNKNNMDNRNNKSNLDLKV